MEENYNLAKWLAGELSEADLKAFEETPEHNTYQKIAYYSSQLQAPTIDESKLYSKVIATKKRPIKVITLHQSWWFKVAATVLIFVGLSFFYKTSIAISESAENGEQTSLILPDDSQVVLNSGSEIDYKKWNWNHHRQLQLSGEAYFRVAKGKKFEVQTNLGTVTVLGTQFNVKARKNRFDVTCYEGRVKVNYRNKQVVITKGKSVSFENDVLLEVPNTTSTKPAWMSDELAFFDENLEAILQEMERKFDCTINHKNINNSQLFTGTLPANNIDEDLQILSVIYHFKCKKETDKKITLELLNGEE